MRPVLYLGGGAKESPEPYRRAPEHGNAALRPRRAVAALLYRQRRSFDGLQGFGVVIRVAVGFYKGSYKSS